MRTNSGRSGLRKFLQPKRCEGLHCTKLARRPGILLEDARFCVGPDTGLPLWYGRRSQLDVDRGPCRPLSAISPITPLN